MFEVTVRVTVLPEAAARVAVAGVTDKTAPAADWITVIFCEATPVPETVIVAFRMVV
jgi:hypothetical protein